MGKTIPEQERESTMTKSEAERGIRHLCHVWAKLLGVAVDPSVEPRFDDFLSWVRATHGLYLKFRTTTSVTYDVQMWFDQEFKQTWRN